MKILMVNKYLYRKGGSESYMLDLAKKLSEKGHNVEFFGMKDEKNIVGSENLLVNNIDFNSKSFRKLAYPLKVIYSAEARKKIKQHIERFRPDVIHLNNYNYQITPSILYEIKKYKIRVVQTVHDTQMICPYHRLFDYRKLEICEKCKGGKFYNCVLNKCIDNSLPKSVIGTIESYLYKTLGTYNKLIDKYICPSEFIQEKLIEYGFDKDKTIVINNFIKQKPDTHISKKEDYVLYFGRLSPEKGIDTLLKVVRQTPNIHYKFAGSGPMKNQLKRYKNIECTGFVNGEKLNNIIRKANVTVLPSLCYENSPMTALESQMLGTPVIGTNIGGTKELVVHGKTGLLFNPNDTDKLKEYIVKIMEDKELADNLARNCLVHAAKFDIDKYTNILFNEVYKKETEMAYEYNK